MINIYFSDTEAVEACICRLNVMMMIMKKTVLDRLLGNVTVIAWLYETAAFNHHLETMLFQNAF